MTDEKDKLMNDLQQVEETETHTLIQLCMFLCSISCNTGICEGFIGQMLRKS